MRSKPATIGLRLAQRRFAISSAYIARNSGRWKNYIKPKTILRYPSTRGRAARVL